MNNKLFFSQYLINLFIILNLITISNVFGQKLNESNTLILESETPIPSGGSYMLHQKSLYDISDSPSTKIRFPNLLGGIETFGDAFEGFDFNDNATENGGYLFIPPDPIGAAGTDRLIAVVNTMIEARDKSGALLWRDALQDFFSPLSPANFTFDPKVVYDHYEDRFVVVTLERVHAGSNPNPGNTSRILVAVSRTATPTTATSADWYYTSINSEESIGVYDHWVDYPGFEVDEEAVYITGHMFAHPGGSTSYRVRLWIINKGVTSGFYSGNTASVNIYDPIGIYAHTTTMPALVYGTNGAGTGIGTYLVSYSGISDGTNEYLQVIRINNPLSSPTFTQSQINIGDLENTTIGMPNAPQSGTSVLIETNDRRALDAVWRNDRLWFTTTIVPRSGSDTGEATAHWFKLNTSSWPPSLDDHGNIGGEDIHISGGVYTYFPSLAVNDAGDAYFGFSASSANIYAGAYCAGRKSTDASGTVRTTETVHAGTDYYLRTFGSYPTDRNRWGDYSGASLDPTDDNLFWIFNEYATTRGTTIGSEDGRWGTAWASVSFVQSIFANGADASISFSQTSPSTPETDWPFGKFSLDNTGNDAMLDSIIINISGSYSGLQGSNPFRLKANNNDDFATATDIGIDASESLGTVTFNNLNDALPTGTRYYWVTVDLSISASGTITGTIASSDAIYLSGASLSNSSNYGDLNTGPDVSLPVELSTFEAEIENNFIVLNWRTQSEIDNVGFIVQRSLDNSRQFEEVSSYKEDPALKGLGNSATGKNYSFTDLSAEMGNTYKYRLADVSFSGEITYSDIIQIHFENDILPKQFTLKNAYPNPFNPVTTIRYGLPKDSEVHITIFDISGRKIKTLISSEQQAGWYDMQWNGVNDQNFQVSSGMYLYKMTAGNFTQTKKILLIR